MKLLCTDDVMMQDGTEAFTKWMMYSGRYVYKYLANPFEPEKVIVATNNQRTEHILKRLKYPTAQEIYSHHFRELTKQEIILWNKIQHLSILNTLKVAQMVAENNQILSLRIEHHPIHVRLLHTLFPEKDMEKYIQDNSFEEYIELNNILKEEAKVHWYTGTEFLSFLPFYEAIVLYQQPIHQEWIVILNQACMEILRFRNHDDRRVEVIQDGKRSLMRKKAFRISMDFIEKGIWAISVKSENIM